MSIVPPARSTRVGADDSINTQFPVVLSRTVRESAKEQIFHISFGIGGFNCEVQHFCLESLFSFQSFVGFVFGIPPLPFGKGTEGKGLSDVNALSPTLSQREREIQAYSTHPKLCQPCCTSKLNSRMTNGKIFSLAQPCCFSFQLASAVRPGATA